MASKLPRAFGLGPLETIVNVQWLSGFYITVAANAVYNTGTPGSRIAETKITPAGKKLGGVVIAEKIETAHGVTNYKALLRFSRRPKTAFLTDPVYEIKFSGALTITDDFGGDITLFCGTSTSSGSVCYRAELVPPPNPFGQMQIIGTIRWDYSSPAGSSTLTWDYVAADVSLDQSGHCYSLGGGSSEEIWYEQGGVFVNTHRPCSELSGGTTSRPQHIEGWRELLVHVYSIRGMRVRKTADWDVTDTFFDDEIEPIPGPKGLKADQAYRWAFHVQRIIQGTNSDHLPQFEDIPNCTIPCTLYIQQIDKFRAAIPPQPKTDKKYKTIASYPVSPQFMTYAVQFLTIYDWRIHFTTPNSQKRFPPGSGIPPSENFTS